MTPRCQFCGEFESEETQIASGYDTCWDCIVSLIENEQERRGLAAEERARRQYFSGEPTQADRDRQDLRDAGRGHLAP